MTFERRPMRGWEVRTRATCRACGFEHEPGPLTLCCDRPILEVSTYDTVVLEGSQDCEQFPNGVSIHRGAA